MSVDDNIAIQIEKKIIKKHPALVVMGIIIPLLIIGYIFYANVLVSHNFQYFYDIGEPSEKYLSPANRISAAVQENESYRNMTSQLVYFTVPITRGAETISVSVRYQANFPNKTTFSLGAKNQANWSYEWHQLPVSNSGEWLVGETSFNISSLHPENGKLSLVFNAPHLNPNVAVSNLDMQVPIDWINSSVYKLGWKK